MSPEPRKSERPTNPQMSKLAEQLRELDLQAVQEIEAPKRSREDIKVVCLKCGAEFEKSPYNIFYRSPHGACPSCALEKIKQSPKPGSRRKGSSQTTKLTLGDLLGREDFERLSALFDYWKPHVSNIRLFDSFSRDTDFKSEPTLLKFLIETVISELYEDLKLEALVDQVAQALSEISGIHNKDEFERTVQSTVENYDKVDDLLKKYDMEDLIIVVKHPAVRRMQQKLIKKQSKKEESNFQREEIEFAEYDFFKKIASKN